MIRKITAEKTRVSPTHEPIKKEIAALFEDDNVKISFEDISRLVQKHNFLEIYIKANKAKETLGKNITQLENKHASQDERIDIQRTFNKKKEQWLKMIIGNLHRVLHENLQVEVDSNALESVQQNAFEVFRLYIHSIAQTLMQNALQSLTEPSRNKDNISEDITKISKQWHDLIVQYPCKSDHQCGAIVAYNKEYKSAKKILPFKGTTQAPFPKKPARNPATLFSLPSIKEVPEPEDCYTSIKNRR